MKKLIKLLKVNILSFLGTDKKTAKILLFCFLIAYFGYMMYFFSKGLMEAYTALNCPEILLIQFFALASVTIFLTNTFKIGSVLFKFKDYDLLMSLPIKKSVVLTSKLSILYITNLILTLLFMIPSYMVYITSVETSALFHLMYFVSLLIIPLVPIIISTIIGTLITSIAAKFRFKKIVNFLASLMFIIVILFISFGTQNTTSMDMANIGKSMVGIFNKTYPLTFMYSNIITDYSWLDLCLFISIPVILFAIYIKIVSYYHGRINNNLSREYTNTNFKLKKEKRSGLLKALYKKELRRYFSSVNYILNTCMGAIMLTLSVILLILIGGDKVNELLKMGNVSGLFEKYGPLLVGSFCALNCTTFCSISLEGKSLWIIKSIPVKPIKIFMAKIMVNLTILIPVIIINSVTLIIYNKFGLFTSILMFVTPFIYAIFISTFGVLLNLIFPKFDWKNEISAIKQSVPAFLNILCGAIVGVIPFVIKTNLSNNIYILIVTGIVLLLDVVLFICLNTYGRKRFIKL